MTKTNTRLLFSILLVFSTLLFYTGCVDTGVENIDSSFDFSSQVSVANLVPGSGTATVSLNNEQIGTAAVGAQTSTADIQSGSQKMAVSYTSAGAQDFQFTADTEVKLRMYIVSDGTSQSIVKDRLRYTWQTPDSEEGEALFPQDTTQISLFNGSPDLAVDGITISGGAASVDTTFETSVAFKSQSGYIKVPVSSSANLTVGIIIDGDSLLTSVAVSATPQSRYSVVLYDSSSSIKHKVFTDD